MVFLLALSPSVPPGLGPSDLLTAVLDPVHFHSLPSYAMLVGRSPLALNRHTAVIMWTAPIPRHGRGIGAAQGPPLYALLGRGASDPRAWHRKGEGGMAGVHDSG